MKMKLGKIKRKCNLYTLLYKSTQTSKGGIAFLLQFFFMLYLSTHQKETSL